MTDTFWDRVRTKYKVDEATGCWLWTASTKEGYGQIKVPDRASPRTAHNVVWEHFNGPVPEGMELDHLCRVRPCVNPEHMQPVLHRTNTQHGARGFDLTGLCRAGLHDVTNNENVIVWRTQRLCRACREQNKRASDQARSSW